MDTRRGQMKMNLLHGQQRAGRKEEQKKGKHKNRGRENDLEMDTDIMRWRAVTR